MAVKEQHFMVGRSAYADDLRKCGDLHNETKIHVPARWRDYNGRLTVFMKPVRKALVFLLLLMKLGPLFMRVSVITNSLNKYF